MRAENRTILIGLEHGGKLEVSTEIGGGSVFSVWLPLPPTP
jgi:signal transduction histidine kinase